MTHCKIGIKTQDSSEIRDITSRVEESIDIENGLCVVYVPHTTAGVMINEAEERLIGDIENKLQDLIPKNDDYSHDDIDNNADAHLRSMLLSTDVSIPVMNNSLEMGTWQSILFYEGDGPRKRELVITCIDD